MRKLTAVLSAALAALPVVIGATPSTLVWIPSTDIQPKGVFHLGYDTYTSPGSDATNATVYGVTYGVSEQIEVGIDYFSGTNRPWFFNAKLRVLEENESNPAVALGIYNVSPKSDVTQNLAYALVSKTFAGTRFHAGYATGKKSVLGRDENMVLLGIDRQLDDKWWVAADYQGGKSFMGALSVGAAYKFADNASVLVGYDFYNDSSIKDTVTVQIDIDL